MNFLVNLYLTYSGVVQDSAGGFFQVSNLHNILMIPFFVTMMYCFKVNTIIAALNKIFQSKQLCFEFN